MKFVAEGSPLLVWVAAGLAWMRCQAIELTQASLPCLGGSGLGALPKCLSFLAAAGLHADEQNKQYETPATIHLTRAAMQMA